MRFKNSPEVGRLRVSRNGGRRALPEFLGRVAAFSLILSFLLGGCAYYNTFYHAKRYYRAAERSRLDAEKKGQETNNFEQYKKCIDKCKKLIDTYPGSKWQDDAHLLMAKASYGRKDYLFAERTLKRFQTRFPESELLPEAIYWSGLTSYADADFATARRTWVDLLERFPAYDDRESVEYYIAESHWKENRFEEAIEVFRAFLNRYPKGDRAVEARLQLAQILMDDKQFQEAADILGEVANRGKEEEDRLRAQMLWGEALEAQHLDEEALELYINLVLQLDPKALSGRMDADLREEARRTELAQIEAARQDSLLQVGFSNPDSIALAAASLAAGDVGDTGNQPVRRAVVRRDINKQRDRQLAQAMLREGSVLVKLNRPWEAIEAFEQVVAEFNNAPVAAEAQYRIGYVHEVLLEDFDLAQQSYDKVSRQGISAFREEAVRRSKNLTTVRNLMSQASTDSLSQAQAAAAEARFMRAELYLFQQDDPDRALEEYRQIETEFSGSDPAAKAGLAVAWLLMHSLGDSSGSLDKYAEIVENYPQNEYGRRAAQVMYGPEKEPEDLEFAGPTLDQLRDPENLALLSPEAEAALEKMDADLAQAEVAREELRNRPPPPEPDPAGDPGQEVLSLGDIVTSTPEIRARNSRGDTGDPGDAEPPPGSVPAPAATPGTDPASGDTGLEAAGTESPTDIALGSPEVDPGSGNNLRLRDPKLPIGELQDPPADPGGANAAPAQTVPTGDPAVTPIPGDEPFLWEKTASGPNPLYPVTGEAPPPRSPVDGATPGSGSEDRETVPGHLLDVPRGLYLDPLAVPDTLPGSPDPETDPETEQKKEAAPADSTGDGDRR